MINTYTTKNRLAFLAVPLAVLALGGGVAAASAADDAVSAADAPHALRGNVVVAPEAGTVEIDPSIEAASSPSGTGGHVELAPSPAMDARPAKH